MTAAVVRLARAIGAGRDAAGGADREVTGDPERTVTYGERPSSPPIR